MSSGIAIYTYLDEMVSQSSTDLYLTVGVPPTIRKDNKLSTITDEKLEVEDLEGMLSEVLTSRQRREFDANMELNLALDMGQQGRFRINVLKQRQHPGMVIRRITSDIPSFEELNLPEVFKMLAMEKRGLILISGVTSSGKSTSLASMMDYRNTKGSGHIITIEDPVEYYHAHKGCIITQREVGIDTVSYNVALKNALRQKPDVILVGEVRDEEVMEQAISAAETGHLCLSTIHTNNASQAIERIINFFPEERQMQIRIALSMNLRSIVSQRLVAKKGGGVVVALEVLLNEALVKELILKGKTKGISDVMAKNNALGMVTFDQSLFKLYTENTITSETAIVEADISSDMKMKIQQYELGGKDSSSGLPQIDTSRLSL